LWQSGVTTGEVIYRPSLATKIKHIAAWLPEDGRQKALAITQGEIEPESILSQHMPREETLQIIDLASEYL
jgi:hypothetical protein